MRVSELLHRNSVLLHADLTTRDQAIDLLVDLQEANGVITNATAYYNEIRWNKFSKIGMRGCS